MGDNDKVYGKPDKICISGSKMSNLRKKMGYMMLPNTVGHVKVLETLVYRNIYRVHNDPFDKIMIAQAKADG